MLKRCPVCGNIGRAYGKKTCGAPECVREWKSYPAPIRIRATFHADYPGEEYPNETPDKSPTEMTEELKDLLTKPLQRENDLTTAEEALKSIFGDKKGKL